jgi:3-dehydroshikimate dehydratase
LKTIEWGGDIHVPAGDLARARQVRQWSEDAGVGCAAYGSYYRLRARTAEGVSFEAVLESAVALGAPTLRIWAGSKASAKTSEEERAALLEDAHRIGELARASGVTLSLEYHADTLTDTRESVLRLMAELPDPVWGFLWQPANGETVEPNVKRLQEVLPRLRHIHVFHWWPTAAERLPLEGGEDRWRTYLHLLRSRATPTPCLLEFVLGDNVDQFFQDARTLRRWLEEAS